VPCFALGTVATGFLNSTDFLPALSLTSVLAVLIAFFSDFFSAFFSDLAMLRKTESRVEGERWVRIKFGDGRTLRQRGPICQRHARSSCSLLLAMSDSEGNFDVIILGTGLVESIAAA
jgi:hypothetical protein